MTVKKIFVFVIIVSVKKENAFDDHAVLESWVDDKTCRNYKKRLPVG